MTKIPIYIASHNRNRVSILAFYILLVKISKNHGRIEYFTYAKAKRLTGLSENTLRKHIRHLVRLEWAYWKDNHLNFVSLKKIAKSLNVSRRLRISVEGDNLSDIRRSIEEKLVLRKMKQCQWVIDRKAAILNESKGDYDSKKSFMRFCRRRGYSVEQFNDKLEISLIKLSRLFGWSISKVHRIIQRLVFKDFVLKKKRPFLFLGLYDYKELDYGVFIHHGCMYKSMPIEYSLLV